MTKNSLINSSFIIVFLCLFGTDCTRDIEAEKTKEYWTEIAAVELKSAIESQKLNTNVAKNVILFLGDGMGVSTVTAGRILKGQIRGESGEETKLAMEQFPHAALSKTYSVNKQVADSASTATAYLCGVKTNYYTIGLNAKVVYNNCQSSKGNAVDSILVDSFKAGKSTGIVTTTQLGHATPGGAYAHSASRKWINDADLPDEAKENECRDITRQFYDNSHMITVALAGGRADMIPVTSRDPEYSDQSGKREDGMNLINMWKKKMHDNGFEPAYVWNKTEFRNVNVEKTDRLLGLFEPMNMQYDANRLKDGSGEPSLAEMTEKAIQILQKNTNGYFLLVEGGRIDHGHHSNAAYLALHDVVAFDDAIEKAVEMTSEDDTLIIATADHSHVFTMGGYSDRGNDIFGIAPSGNSPDLAEDNKPYTTLLYGNGPGYNGHYRIDSRNYVFPILNRSQAKRKNLTKIDTTRPDYVQQTAVPTDSETHGGEDVAIFARGPMAHLFHGTHEQNYIAHVMRYVSCVGGFNGHCEGESDVNSIKFFGMSLSPSAAQFNLYLQCVLGLINGIILTVLSVYIYKNRAKLNLRMPCEKKKTSKNETEMPLRDESLEV